MAIRSSLRFVDLLVEPAVDRFRLNEYGRYEEIIAAGYDAGREALRNAVPPACPRSTLRLKS